MPKYFDHKSSEPSPVLRQHGRDSTISARSRIERFSHLIRGYLVCWLLGSTYTRHVPPIASQLKTRMCERIDQDSQALIH